MVTGTPRSTTPIRKLPVQPRPRAGEGRTAFIERLATANFLRPSYLRAYLRDPDSTKAAPSWERLAAVTGRDPVLLQEVLERKQCVECGRPLPIGDSLTMRRRCSQACRQESYRKRHPKPLKATRITHCQECGQRLSYHRQPRQYCSPTCRQAAYRRRMNAARPPQIRAKSCRACEAPSSPAPPPRSTVRSAAPAGPTPPDASIAASHPCPSRPPTSLGASNRTAASSAERHSPWVPPDRSG